MRKLILALTLAASPEVALAQPSPASLPQPTAVLPSSSIGRLGQQLLDAVDSGDTTVVSRFVRDHLGHDVRGRTPAQMAAMLVKLHAQSGGLRVERVHMAGSALRVMTEARNGRRWLGMELEPAVGDSARIANITIFPMDGDGMRMPPAPWATTPLDDDRLAELIRAKVKQAADSDRFSGVVLVAHGDRVLVHDAYGYADRDAGRRNTLDTPFGTASLGKMFTAVAIGQLVAAGKLRWDDTLARILPSYPNRDAARRITIRQLLTHTAGVPDPFLSARFDIGKDYGSHERMLATFADEPLTPNAGRSFEYSNGNFATLAAVVEHLSGLRYDDYLRRNVWGRAGMRMPSVPSALGYARFTELDPLGVEPRRPETIRVMRSCPHVLGFGCGAYSADDLFRFARALRTGRLLPMSVTDTLTSGKVVLGGPMKYAFGFFDQTMEGMRVVGHSGSNPDTGHDADLEMVWDGEWTVVVLSNYDAPAGMQLEMPILDLLARQQALRR